jgi:hypothetical protein
MANFWIWDIDYWSLLFDSRIFEHVKEDIMIQQQLSQQQIQVLAAAQAQASAQAAAQAAQAAQAQRDRDNSIRSRALATVQAHAEQREVSTPIRATVLNFRKYGRI